MANQNYLLTLRFLCACPSAAPIDRGVGGSSWRLTIFTPEDSGPGANPDSIGGKESKAYFVKCFHAIVFSHPLLLII